MHYKWLIVTALCLVCISAGLVLWQRNGMIRTLTISGADAYPLKAYDDRQFDGGSTASVTQTAHAMVLNCTLRQRRYAWPFCGFRIYLGRGRHGIDLSNFTAVALDIQTTGPAPLPVRVYLRNFNPAYSRKGDIRSHKIDQIQYIPDQDKGPFIAPLNMFKVPAWWIVGQHIPPQQASPEFTDVTSIEIATGSDSRVGHYTIRVRSIVFQDKWLTAAQLQWIILALWLFFAIGAASYLVYRSHRSAQRIRKHNDDLEDINAALKLERQELATLATHDELTGLLNRVGMRNRFHDMMSKARQSGEHLSAVFIDIDKFKSVNDHYGHAIGDEVLHKLAQLLSHLTSAQHCLCRWGGEEFILLCANTTLDTACNTAEQLRTHISQYDWPYDIALRCSFGVAQLKPGETADPFLQRADEALYKAKKMGRNRVAYDASAHSGKPGSTV